jgi:hypothetical protein
VELFRHGHRSRSIGYAVLALTCAAVAASAVGSADRQRVREFEFTSERPGKATGVETVATFPGATLGTAVAKIVTKPARGTELDTSVPERCKASDEELRAEGTAACPQGSRVGDGEVEIAELGSGNVTLFNARRETIFLIEFPATGIRTVGRESADERSQRIEIPEGVTLRRIELDIDRIREGGENYIETPERCPKSEKWINKGTFTYRDGVEQTETVPTPCDRPEG